MINVVGRPPLEGDYVEGVTLVCFDHVLCDLRNTPMDWDAARFPCNGPVAVRPITCPFTGYVSKDVPGYVTIKIEHLSAIRLDPLCSADNLVLDSVDTAGRELDELKHAASNLGSGLAGGYCVVCEMTNVDEGRDVDGLARCTKHLANNVFLAFGASLARAEVEAAAAKPYGDRDVVAALKRELVVGVTVRPDAAGCFYASAPAAPRAAFVGPVRPEFRAAAGEPSVDLTELDAFYLRAAAAAAASTGAPLVVSLPPCRDGTVARRRADAVLAACAGCRTILRRGEFAADLLAAGDGTHAVLVDGFGRPLEGAVSPDVSALDPRRCCVSTGVRHRTQLAAYGGFGYAHAANLARAPLECLGGFAYAHAANQARAPVECFRSAAPALAWAKKPKKPKVDTVTLRCTLCGTTFEVKRGEHYGKYDFVYCGRACLGAHRERTYAADAATGPTASAQGV